jgi:hypothetical protein
MTYTVLLFRSLISNLNIDDDIFDNQAIYLPIFMISLSEYINCLVVIYICVWTKLGIDRVFEALLITSLFSLPLSFVVIGELEEDILDARTHTILRYPQQL